VLNARHLRILARQNVDPLYGFEEKIC